MSDGEINLALLQYKSEVGSGIKNPGEFVGIHHFGFQCDDLEQQQKQIEKAGGNFFFDLGDPDDDDFERKFRDPNGIIFDINWKGWTMTTGKVKTKSAAAGKKVGKKTSKARQDRQERPEEITPIRTGGRPSSVALNFCQRLWRWMRSSRRCRASCPRRRSRAPPAE